VGVRGEGRGRDRGKVRSGKEKEGEGKEGGKGKGRTTAIPNFFRPCVGLTVRILLCSVRSTRSGPFATRLSVCLSVCLSVTLTCCAQTTERIKLPFRVRVTPKHCDIIVLHGVLIPLKIAVRGTSPKFTHRALPQSHLAVYISGIV